MTTELDPRLKLCWELAERDRDKTPTLFRRDLDGGIGLALRMVTRHQAS